MSIRPSRCFFWAPPKKKWLAFKIVWMIQRFQTKKKHTKHEQQNSLACWLRIDHGPRMSKKCPCACVLGKFPPLHHSDTITRVNSEIPWPSKAHANRCRNEEPQFEAEGSQMFVFFFRLIGKISLNTTFEKYIANCKSTKTHM